MKQLIQILLCSLFFSVNVCAQDQNRINNPETLSETPLYPVPAEMTFEEYQDMNRRMSQAFLWSSIPVPGVTHYYAGENKKARQLFYIGLGGLACIIAGAVSMEEGTWPDYDENIHVIHNQGQDDEKWYERIPVRMEGDVIHYDLKEIHKEQNGDGGGLIALGAVIIVADFIYDRLWGFQKIEEKRDRVRFKYGQQLNLSFNPTFDLSAGKVGLRMNMSFQL
jgi:hypothetical protein